MPREKGLEPSVEHRAVSKQERLNRFLTLVSNKDSNALPIAQDAEFVVSALEEGKHVSYPLASGYGAYLYVVSGKINIGANALAAGDAAKITGSGSVDISAEQDSELALVVVPV